MHASAAHIAGVGTAEDEHASLDGLAVAAATKALLDAGATYSDVQQGIVCFLDDGSRIPPSCLATFGMAGTPVCEVDNQSGLRSAVQSIHSGQCQCTLIVGIDSEARRRGDKTRVVVVSMVLVSDLFLTSHAFLKDSAVTVNAHVLAGRYHSQTAGGPNDSRTVNTALRAALRQAHLKQADIQLVELQSTGEGSRPQIDGVDATPAPDASKSLQSFAGTTGMTGLCGLVWRLRGWAHDRPLSKVKHCLRLALTPQGAAEVVIVCRSDGKDAPAWDEIENVRDGRERLGYNPAIEVHGISVEDLKAVSTNEEFLIPDAGRRLKLPVKGGDRAALARL